MTHARGSLLCSNYHIVWHISTLILLFDDTNLNGSNTKAYGIIMVLKNNVISLLIVFFFHIYIRKINKY